MQKSLQPYAVITGAYWGFTLTDGALRMLVVLYFYQLGYDALTIAFLFLFYEFFGVITNLVGGWLAAQFGLQKTLYWGLLLQIIALSLLAIESWLSVTFVMFVQAISGIAKDLNKMSAKSSLKLIVPEQQGKLFTWVARLTGSKNTLKGIGFFSGGLLLEILGYQGALLSLATGLSFILLMTIFFLPNPLGHTRYRPKFKELLAKSTAINYLSGARLFLFAARDIWFVVALPVFLQEQLNWGHTAVGSLLAIWIIIYGLVQSSAPNLLNFKKSHHPPNIRTSLRWSNILIVIPAWMSFVLTYSLLPTETVVLIGLGSFAIIFAINSAIHSYLILAYARTDQVSTDVGFYYMANAVGRLIGTLFSGIIYQYWGFIACLFGAVILMTMCSLVTFVLSKHAQT